MKKSLIFVLLSAVPALVIAAGDHQSGSAMPEMQDVYKRQGMFREVVVT